MALKVITCVLAVLLLIALCVWILLGRNKDDAAMLVKRILDVVIVALAAFIIVCSVKLYANSEKETMPLGGEVTASEDITTENPKTAE